MSNTSLSVIARSDVATQCNANPTRDWLYGITTVADEDPFEAISMFQLPQNEDIPDPLPDVKTCWLQGMHLVNQEQFQFQDIFGGTDPGRILVVCPPLVVPEGSTVSKGGTVCATDVSVGGFLTADFIMPAVDGSVQIVVDDTAWITTWLAVPNTEIHISGAGIFTVTSVDDTTLVTVVFTGVASALVKIAA